jgi:hypothetical protein
MQQRQSEEAQLRKDEKRLEECDKLVDAEVQKRLAAAEQRRLDAEKERASKNKERKRQANKAKKKRTIEEKQRAEVEKNSREQMLNGRSGLDIKSPDYTSAEYVSHCATAGYSNQELRRACGECSERCLIVLIMIVRYQMACKSTPAR